MLLRISFIFLLIMAPACFSWSYETHVNICEAVHDELPDMDKDSLSQGCVYPDEYGDFANHVCYSNYCPAEGRADKYLKIGRNYFIENDTADASFSFGVACHYISDSLQPQHTGKSYSEEHIWFEDIVVTGIKAGLTDRNQRDISGESSEYVKNISNFYKKKDTDSAKQVAEKFAGYAADLCYTLIAREMSNTTKVNIPDCSTIKGILRNDCNLMNIGVIGKLLNPIHRTSSAGNRYTIFYLSDGINRIKVFSWGDVGIKEGSDVTVEGIFYKEKIVSGYTFTNEIEASSVRENTLSPLLMLFIVLIILIAAVSIFLWLR